MWVLSLLFACEPETALPEVDPVELASNPGPHAVGYRQAEATWQPPGLAEPRTIPLEVWYPAVDGGEPAATYLVAGVVERDAPLAKEEPAAASGTFPVAVYSHGSGGLGLIGYPFAERLASHGFVVVAPDHVGNTSLDLITGGEDNFIRIMVNRPGDVTAAFDAVADLGLPGDAEQAFLFGHSFGGYTTFAAGGVAINPDVFSGGCTEDDANEDCVDILNPDVRAALAGGQIDARVDAIAPQAPALVGGFADGAIAGLTIPTLLQSAAGDITTPDETEAGPAWDQLDDPRDRWIKIPEGGHYSFISVCDDLGLELINTFQPGAEDDGCGPQNTPTLETIPALATYLTAFATVHVGGDPTMAPVLDQEIHPAFRVKLHE